MPIDILPHVFYKNDNTVLLTNNGKVNQCIELMKSYNENIKLQYKLSRDIKVILSIIYLVIGYLLFYNVIINFLKKYKLV